LLNRELDRTDFAMKHTILLVDDEQDNLDALERIFRSKYNVLKAISAEVALGLLKSNSVALIISDQRMPVMNGSQFLQKSIAHQPNAIRILLTGFTDMESLVDAINSGEIYRYITKPWDPREILITVDKAIEKFELRESLQSKNEELSRALLELRALDKAKTSFMMLVNHELRTPLTTMISFLELMKETELNEEQTRYFNRIQSGAEKFKEIIMDVLDLLRAEMKLTEIHQSRFELGPVVKSVAAEVLAHLKLRDIKVEFDFDSNLSVNADENIIRSVLKRTLKNAIQFSKNSQPVNVRIKKTSQTESEIEITNHAETISEATLSAILKPFGINEEMMNHSKGLGLGLSISNAQLSLLNSKLELRSSDTTFRVCFRLSN
jgi:two-component system sensor histidine kinase/response regulator